LEAYTGGYIHVEQPLLQTLLNSPLTNLIVSNKWGEIGVEVTERLRTRSLTLKSVEEVNDLP
jgi:hypothetical protein